MNGDGTVEGPAAPLPVAAAPAPGGAQEHLLPVTRQARYYTLGAAPADAREVWYVLHGYGQLAAYFIRHFAALDNTRRLVVAPEALSRFYLDDTYRRAGASWMTREDREHEIEDYLAYLSSLHARLAAGLPGNAAVHVLGFSQGCETAARWATLGGLRPRRLMLWGGRLPSDLNLALYRDALRQARLTLIRGAEDTYATPARAAELEDRLNLHTIPYSALVYDGGHHLDADVLRALAAEG